MVSSSVSHPPTDVSTVPDGELLRRYLADRNSPALEALVRRHGPMVWGVCCRVSADVHDAEDAFQATFLVFVRKASAVRPAEMIGPWLYRVATRTALKARALVTRRRAREKQVDVLPEAAAPEAPASADWLPFLDHEVARLPAKYRLPVLLCELQGLSRAEAARRLELAEGTLSSRLSRARTLLRRRLSKRGVGAAVLVAVVLFPAIAPAAVPSALVETTIQAATSFAAGAAVATPSAVLAAAVLAGMRTARLAVLIAGLAIVILLGGVGWLATRPGPPTAVVDTRSDLEKMQGGWVPIEKTWNGQQGGPFIAELEQRGLVIQGDMANWPVDSDVVLNQDANPKQIDLTCRLLPPPNNFMLGIYELNGDQLKTCFGPPAVRERPTKFAAPPDSGRYLITFKRAQAAQ
jgi:RNA polymerase sigma-70 factor (ECF subfamily)